MPKTSKTKTCGACLRSLPIADFWQHRKMRDGLQHACKDCQRAVRGDYPRQATIRPTWRAVAASLDRIVADVADVVSMLDSLRRAGRARRARARAA